jgi:guanylate kinase
VKSNALLILVSAPSGGGKTTLTEQVLAADAQTVRAITCTTRAPRQGERDGHDYFFLEPADFLKRVQAGHFLEHATVYGNSYGTLRAEVLGKLRQSQDVLLNVDVQGAAAIREKAESELELKRALVTVFLAPASLAMLEQRLRSRGQDSPGAIQKRLSVARQEIAQWRHFDYVITSESVAEDLRRMQSILAAERMRSCRVPPPSLD